MYLDSNLASTARSWSLERRMRESAGTLLCTVQIVWGRSVRWLSAYSDVARQSTEAPGQMSLENWCGAEIKLAWLAVLRSLDRKRGARLIRDGVTGNSFDGSPVLVYARLRGNWDLNWVNR